MPYRVDIVGCADVGGASFANDGLRKLSPSYSPKRACHRAVLADVM